MKTILPASSGSIRFLNLLKRSDGVLKICTLGASVAGMQRYFCARHERIGRWNCFCFHKRSGSVNVWSLSRKGSALHVFTCGFHSQCPSKYLPMHLPLDPQQPHLPHLPAPYQKQSVVDFPVFD